MSRKRRRSQAFPDPEEVVGAEEQEEGSAQAEEEELEARRLQVWDAVREDHFEGLAHANDCSHIIIIHQLSSRRPSSFNAA